MIRIEELDLSVRAYNVLKRVGISYVEELEEKTYEDLLKIRNMGRANAREIAEKVKLKDKINTELAKREILKILEKYDVDLDIHYSSCSDCHIVVTCKQGKFESVKAWEE